MGDGPHNVNIQIDRERYESPSRTTGEALYALANIGPHRELFREGQGDHEDDQIPHTEPEVRVEEGEHFYTEKEFKVFVNTEPKEVVGPKVTYDQVLKLAFDPVPTGENIIITMDYTDGPRANPSGTLKPHHSVYIKNGMIFSVDATDRS
jgi:hypothetical protein